MSEQWYSLSASATKTYVMSIRNLIFLQAVFMLLSCKKDVAGTAAFNQSQNKAPVVNAGNDIALTWPTNYCTLEGSATDPEGETLRFAWEKLGGPAGFFINDRSSAKTVVSGLQVGEYTFEFSATDPHGAKSRDTIRVSIMDVPYAPLVRAGNNVYVPLPQNTCRLTGYTDYGGGVIVSYYWRKVSGPASCVIETPDSINTLVAGLEQGDYQFEFAAKNSSGLVGRDTVSVYVFKPGENERIFSGLEWQCTMGCWLLVNNFHTYVPKNTRFTVYIRESSSSQWQLVKYETQVTSADKYSWGEYDDGESDLFWISANKAEGKADVKIQF